MTAARSEPPRMTSQNSAAVAYPDGVTERDHIAHDMRMGRFPQRSSLAEFLTERRAALSTPATTRFGIGDCLPQEAPATTGDVRQFLFKLLDDIDTLDDACRSDDAAFREAVRKVQRRRFEVATTDGYSVTFNEAPATTGEGEVERLRAIFEAGVTQGRDLALSYEWGEAPSQSNDDAFEDAKAALPPSSGWETITFSPEDMSKLIREENPEQLPAPSSGWEAGAEAAAMKAEEALRTLSRDAATYAEGITDRTVQMAYRSKAAVLWDAANAVMDMPLPPPPSREG